MSSITSSNSISRSTYSELTNLSLVVSISDEEVAYWYFSLEQLIEIHKEKYTYLQDYKEIKRRIVRNYERLTTDIYLFFKKKDISNNLFLTIT